MKTHFIAVIGWILLVAAGFAAHPALAAGPAPEIRIGTIAPGSVGESVRVPVLLLDPNGLPLAGQQLVLAVDGRDVDTARTDRSGRAVLKLPGEFAAGAYSLEVAFWGNADFAAVSTSVEIDIAPAQLTIQLLPPRSGVAFTLGDTGFASGPDGVARVQVDRPGVYSLEITVPESETEQIVFAGWESGERAALRELRIAGDQVLQAGFEILYLADFVFLSPDEVSIPAARVGSLEISSSDGRYRILDPAVPVWLEANMILNRLSGLDSVAITHAVQEVLVDGANVVNRGQQRFILQGNGVITLDLLMFDLEFTALDLFFSAPLEGELELTFPDGDVQRFPVEADGRVSLPPLARGSYEARLVAEDSLSLDLPVFLSRDQVVRVPAIRITNLALLAALVLVQVALLAVAGRLRRAAAAEGVQPVDL